MLLLGLAALTFLGLNWVLPGESGAGQRSENEVFRTPGSNIIFLN